MMLLSTHRVSALIALALLACCLAAALAGAQLEANSGSETAEHLASGKDSEIKDRVFKFVQFKAVFHKTYKTIAEETHRQALYLANLFQMFTSYFNYKFKRASSFSAVNQMSDWTDQEFRDTLVDAETYAQAKRDYLAQESESEIREEINDESTSATLGDIINKDARADETKKVLARRLEHSSALRDHIDDDDDDDEDDDDDDDDYYNDDVHNIAVGDCDGKSGDSCALGNKTTLGERIMKFGGKVGKKLKDGAEKGLGSVDALVQDTYHKVHTRKVEYRPDLPDEVFVDHRNSGCMTRVKDQAKCGSCYIFAPMALYEWAYCKGENRRVQFSEQYLLDCGQKIHMHGCDGGWVTQIGQFIGKYGLELSETYRYHAKERKCPYKSAKVPRDAMGFVRMDKPKLSSVSVNSLEKQLETSPVLVSIYPADRFSHYGGGIDEGKGCGGDRFSLHAVLLVGHGRKDGHEYWIMRNSYGIWFGESGYYKVRKDSKCLADFGVGYTLKALKGGTEKKNKKELVLQSGTDNLKSDGQTDDASTKVEEKQYKFFENPKYDWKILAGQLEMAQQSPPETTPTKTKLPFWPF